MPHPFRSLRIRLLLPLLAVAFLASLAVAVASHALADRWAREQIASRFRGIESTLSEASYPLTQQVVRSIAQLTDTELITFDSNGSVLQSSIELPASAPLSELASQPNESPSDRQITIGEQGFRYGGFSRTTSIRNDAAKVVVLFDEAGLSASRLRASSLPLVTGLSTVILLTSVTLLLASRLIRRLSRLQQHVDQVAAGDFETHVPVGVHDEVGLLGAAVTTMSGQLKQMWTTLERQQGQKLLHQVAGGLAHQLRNSITGARMAVELHHRDCPAQDDALSVALSQLEQTEGHVRRLLMVASGEQQEDHPVSAVQCIDDVRATMSPTARHLGVALNWQIADDLDDRRVADGPSLHAAVTNLVLNAIQAAQHVDVSFTSHAGQLKVDVVDDGAGPPDDVASEIFEPFVTSKPEGLGLGLPLVARSAQHLGGQVEWVRQDDRTRFTLTVDLLAQST